MGLVSDRVMLRWIIALVLVVAFGAFAAPASAHVHGGSSRDAGPMIAPSSPVPARDVMLVRDAVVVTAVVATLRAPDCDRECDHDAGSADCVCSAACLAFAVPMMPRLPHPQTLAGDGTRYAGSWHQAAHAPPVPPPRA